MAGRINGELIKIKDMNIPTILQHIWKNKMTQYKTAGKDLYLWSRHLLKKMQCAQDNGSWKPLV